MSGVTRGKRQELLQFIAGRKPEELATYLRCDRANAFDRYAVAVVIGIQGVGYAYIGYLPRELSQGMAAVIDVGVQVRAELQRTSQLYFVIKNVRQSLEFPQIAV
ncbi:MAG: hypothetical protein NC081_10040 [Roseburia sp.]|nr:hypothetical protein [Roseburia sp.]